ncbi:MAG TPA: hypothetical protein VFX59_26050, partial [Polyangiales bacterium]|nr:hypothetical protein [Polyangiales bacterium]
MSNASMRARFAAAYTAQARFKEDVQLAGALAREAEPVLEVLAISLQSGALHEGYALLTLLARHAASLGATPGIALTLVDAIAAALEPTLIIDRRQRDELTVVALEGYCAARDERSTRLLRETAAEHQVAVQLAPGCVGIFLAGSHDESDLGPTLERFARDLLYAGTRSCLLDLTRLEKPIGEDLARALGRFCGQAATLGVCSFVLGAPPTLCDQFTRWEVSGGPVLMVDDPVHAR